MCFDSSVPAQLVSPCPWTHHAHSPSQASAHSSGSLDPSPAFPLKSRSRTIYPIKPSPYNFDSQLMTFWLVRPLPTWSSVRAFHQSHTGNSYIASWLLGFSSIVIFEGGVMSWTLSIPSTHHTQVYRKRSYLLNTYCLKEWLLSCIPVSISIPIFQQTLDKHINDVYSQTSHFHLSYLIKE